MSKAETGHHHHHEHDPHEHHHGHEHDHHHESSEEQVAVLTVISASGLSGDMMLAGLATITRLNGEELESMVRE